MMRHRDADPCIKTSRYLLERTGGGREGGTELNILCRGALACSLKALFIVIWE